jgi:ribonuclease HII
MEQYNTNITNVVGVDEVGRGCLAGPVVSGAVILPKELSQEFKDIVKDSKKLSEKKRYAAVELIKKEALDYTVGFVNSETIDKFNILKATHISMHKALNKLKIKPNLILVDGDSFTEWEDVEYETVVKGDNKYYCIAAASILAKIVRDEYMLKLHEEYPYYGWDTNKGYGSKKHRDVIINEGVVHHHRKTFLKKILQNNI